MKKRLAIVTILILCFVLSGASVYAAEGTDNLQIQKEWSDPNSTYRATPKMVAKATMTQEQMLDFYYPVGSYFETSKNDDINELFPGTWVRETSGLVHINASSPYGAEGAGQKISGFADAVILSHSHGVPSVSGTSSYNDAHTHNYGWHTAASGSGKVNLRNNGSAKANTSDNLASHAHSFAFSAVNTTTTENGVDPAGLNMQPYIAVYRWHRVS